MNINKPFFSIVIPTRNRADTLRYTIQTILSQDFQDYEIIVCNNNSIDDTEEQIKSIHDNRIKYIKSEIDLSMSDNWELAYTQVRGKYVTYLADNDGFLNGSLSFLHNLLTLNNLPTIIRWEKNIYHWPSMDSVNKNLMYINLLKNFEILESNKIIQEVLDGEKTFQSLPMIYTSVIKKDLVEILIKKTGRVFHSISPDLSTGFSFAMLEKSYLSLSYGITCGAISAKSNGFNCWTKSNAIEKDFKKLGETSTLSFHKNIPNVRSITAAITESFLKIQEKLASDIFKINYQLIYERIISEVIILNNLELQETNNKIMESSRFSKKLHHFINDFLEKNPLKINLYKDKKVMEGFSNTCEILTLFGNNFNLSTIEDTCNFMSNFYSYSLNHISFPIIKSSTLDQIERNAKIAIWGNGQLSKDLQKDIISYRSDIHIECIIDSFVEDQTSSPIVILPHNLNCKNINYLIIASTFVEEISKIILKHKFNKSSQLLKYEDFRGN
jgi:glycosyltransferase involved in cell wall biosynthesis